MFRANKLFDIIKRKLFPTTTVSTTTSSSLHQLTKMSCVGKNAALIFLHGLGDNGKSWRSSLENEIPQHVLLQCPTAPRSQVTINLGMCCNSWFDIQSLDKSKEEDEKGIHEACESIHKMISNLEILGFSSDKIMLGGFSQGGALALYAGLKYPKKLAGIVALSCWLPLNKEFPAAVNETNKNIPILQCHGTSDSVVPLDWGRASHEVLLKCVGPSNVELKEYKNMAHSSSSEEIKDVMNHVKKCLPLPSQ